MSQRQGFLESTGTHTSNPDHPPDSYGRDASPDAAVPKRRHAPRRVPGGTIRLWSTADPCGHRPNLAVSFLDVSETGARLTVADSLAEGQSVEVVLHGPLPGRQTRLSAQVVWCQAREASGYDVGLCFERPLSYSEWVGS